MVLARIPNVDGLARGDAVRLVRGRRQLGFHRRVQGTRLGYLRRQSAEPQAFKEPRQQAPKRDS